jgi:hypothetical protein
MIKKLMGLVLVVVFVVSALSGCGMGSANKTAQYDVAPNQAAASGGTRDDAEVNVSFSSDVSDSKSDESKTTTAEVTNGKSDDKALTGGGDVVQDVSNAILAERKVIRSANITVEVEDFDKASGEINSIILGIGFVQSSNINSEKYYRENVQKLIRKGTIVVRVDREKFDKVLNSLKGIGEVLNESINGEDVTDKYYDTESRLRLLKIEESKLEEYLKKLSDLDQVFKTESRLTEIRYQIEALTGNLKKMSDLVDLSTITINISEKYPDADIPPKTKTYGQKLLDNFLDSMKGVVSFVGELVVILVSAIPVLVLLGLFALLAVFIYKKIPKKKPVGMTITKAEEKDKDDGNDMKE